MPGCFRPFKRILCQSADSRLAASRHNGVEGGPALKTFGRKPRSLNKNLAVLAWRKGLPLAGLSSLTTDRPCLADGAAEVILTTKHRGDLPPENWSRDNESPRGA